MAFCPRRADDGRPRPGADVNRLDFLVQADGLRLTADSFLLIASVACRDTFGPVWRKAGSFRSETLAADEYLVLAPVIPFPFAQASAVGDLVCDVVCGVFGIPGGCRGKRHGIRVEIRIAF